MATILSSFGVVLVSCRVNFHVVRSASQYSACRIYMCLHILVINVLINWQLSKQVTCWPVSLDLIACSGVDPSGSSIFFEVFRWQVTSFQVIESSSSTFFKIYMKYVVFMWCTIKILISNWPRKRKFSQLLQAGKTVAFDFPHHGHALVTLYVQFLCSDWSKFDRWGHAENSCGILNLVYFDSWSWQSFVSTCDVFNCFSPLDIKNEIQLLSGVFSYSWLVCLLGFWLRNTSLVKVGNPISNGIVFVFTLLDA